MKKSRSKGKSGFLFVLSVLVIGILAYVGAYGVTIGDYRFKSFGETISRGLDLQGGVYLLEEIQADKVTPETMNRTIDLISRRVNKMGVSETTVVKEGSKRIRIEIPGQFDKKVVEKKLGKSGELKFMGPDKQVILTGKDVKKAAAGYNQEGQPEISLELNEEGTRKFAEGTQKFLNQKISIYMDEDELTSPTVNSVITNGKAVITGSKTLQEAKEQAGIITSGALPVPVKVISSKTVGATLGKNALPLSIKAGKIGMIIVLLFMLLYYRGPGIIADLALVLYVVLTLTVFALAGVVLTLPGIAGFLLTIGMAVDANVLIFERMKEELKTGKSVKSALDSGFHRALSSILDSNITTIIAGLVLYSFGTGSVKGFALTLVIGVLVSMFSALTVTRFLLKLSVEMGLISKVSHFGVKRGEKHA